MFRTIRIQFLAIVMLTLLAVGLIVSGGLRPGMDLSGGAELRYKVLHEPGFNGDRRASTREAADVLRRRVEARQLGEPKVTAYGDDGIIVQLPGVDEAGLRDYKKLIGTAGKLEICAAAPHDLQERYERDRVVPDGYRGVKGSPLLMRKIPVIDGRHIVRAEPRQGAEGGAVRWVTEFELDAEGAKRFDEAARELYERRPAGRLVIVLDDEVRSTPVVGAPAFHGRGQISLGRD